MPIFVYSTPWSAREIAQGSLTNWSLTSGKIETRKIQAKQSLSRHLPSARVEQKVRLCNKLVQEGLRVSEELSPDRLRGSMCCQNLQSLRCSHAHHYANDNTDVTKDCHEKLLYSCERTWYVVKSSFRSRPVKDPLHGSCNFSRQDRVSDSLPQTKKVQTRALARVRLGQRLEKVQIGTVSAFRGK